MKKSITLLSLFLVLLVFVSCSNSKESEIKVEMVSYGPSKVDITKVISVSEMMKQMEGDKDDELEFTLKAEITDVCSSAGCWVEIKKPDGNSIMVIFEDHFTIPTNTKIRTEAYLHGVAYWDTIPVASLKHYAEDAGKSKEEISKITEPSFKLMFEADAITFEKQ
jgi:hypothetical protein